MRQLLNKRILVKCVVLLKRYCRQNLLIWFLCSKEIIDRLGLAVALKDATLLALLNLDAKFGDEILIDGSINLINDTNYSYASYWVGKF